MRVLVLGNGAREHAITWKFSRSFRIAGLYTAPGNAGTSEIATNLPDIDQTNPVQVVEACIDYRIGLVFVGGEAALAAGVVDALDAAGIPAIGATQAASQLEASKVFSKNFMTRYGIPTANYSEFSDFDTFAEQIRAGNSKIVVKKSGLAAGKGVLETDNHEQAIEFGRKILESDSVVVEDFLVGYEVSIFAFSDGKDYVVLPSCADYKKAGEKGTGPNTGGMGAVCPVPWLAPEAFSRIQNEVVGPTFAALKAADLSYRGVLYFGLMMTEQGPKVLEYNVRLGDPEAQVLLPLIKSDFGNLCEAMVQEKLGSFPLEISDKSALGIVVASPGYPGEYPKDLAVTSLPESDDETLLVFHAATKQDGDRILTGGGRCFTVVGIGPEMLQARSSAYGAVKSVEFPGAWWRPDIGNSIFGN